VAYIHRLAGHRWFALALALTLSLAAACGGDDLPGTPGDDGDNDGDGQGTDPDASVEPPDDAGPDLDAAQPDAAVATTARFIGMGNNVSCAVLSTGAVRCWGANEQGQVGGGVISAYMASPTDVMGLTDAVSNDCGTAHCCARTEAGGAKCWGWNAAGELGANLRGEELGNRHTAGAVLEMSSEGAAVDLSGASQVVAGGAHNCALKDGDVWCWGWNQAGQSGIDRAEDKVLLAKANGIADVNELALAHVVLAEHSCAIKSSGEAVCWGLDFEGQLGDGTIGEIRHTAEPVPGLVQTTAMAAGQKHTCAIARPADAPESEPAVFCWGLNNLGQAGPQAANTQPVPIEVPGLSGAVALAGGQSHTCALLGTGRVRCWGANNFGQLGDGTDVSRPAPDDVVNPNGEGPLSGVVQIATGFGNSCARTNNGRVYCWGDNNIGQLGQGTTGEDGEEHRRSLRPVEVPVVPKP